MDLMFAIVEAEAIKPRSQPVWVGAYELRVVDLDNDCRDPRVIRNRKDGYNPVTLARVTSGHGVPKWMARLVDDFDASDLMSFLGFLLPCGG